MEATNACEPSPPAIPRQSAPRAMASRASSARSSPWSSITVSTPSDVASSTNPNLSTLPPPDHGLQRSTGCRGGVHAVYPTGGGSPEAGSHRRSRRQNGCGEERQADERADEGLPVLGPGPQERDDQESSAQTVRRRRRTSGGEVVSRWPTTLRRCRARTRPHRARRTHHCGPRRRRPRPRGAGPRQAKGWRVLGLEPAEGDSIQPRGFTLLCSRCVFPGPSCSCCREDDASDAAGVWPSSCAIPGPRCDRIVGSGRTA